MTETARGGQDVIALIDVVMKGLEAARRNMALRAESGEEFFCGGMYMDSHTLCPVAYWHSDAPEAKPEVRPEVED